MHGEARLEILLRIELGSSECCSGRSIQSRVVNDTNMLKVHHLDSVKHRITMVPR